MDNSGQLPKAPRPRVEASPRITMPALKAAGLLTAQGARGVAEWRAGHQAVGDMAIETVLDGYTTGHLTLTYTANGVPRRQNIQLEAAPLPYGGVRWWAICPVSGARVGTLAFSVKHHAFVSVRAAGMAYSSQSEGVFKRIERRQDKIARRAANLSKYARQVSRRRLEYAAREVRYLWAKTYLALVDKSETIIRE